MDPQTVSVFTTELQNIQRAISRIQTQLKRGYSETKRSDEKKPSQNSPKRPRIASSSPRTIRSTTKALFEKEFDTWTFKQLSQHASNRYFNLKTSFDNLIPELEENGLLADFEERKSALESRKNEMQLQVYKAAVKTLKELMLRKLYVKDICDNTQNDFNSYWKKKEVEEEGEEGEEGDEEDEKDEEDEEDDDDGVHVEAVEEGEEEGEEEEGEEEEGEESDESDESDAELVD
jgi:hypothetical protein